MFDWVVHFSGMELHELLVYFGDRCAKSFQVQPVPICSPCFYFCYSGRWIIEDLAVIYVGACPARAFFKCDERGYSGCSMQASHCGAPLVAEHGLQDVGSVVVAQGLSWSAACGVFLHQGSNPSPALAGGFSAIEPPRSPRFLTFSETFPFLCLFNIRQ